MALCLFLITVNLVFVVGTVYAVDRLNEAARIVPELQDVMAEIITTPSQIVSDDGVLLRSIATKYRKPVTIEKVPQTVINSTLAAEDVRFYNHAGVDLVALGRVAFEAMSKKRQTGGSTITMQLAKRVFTSPVQSMDRKMKDMALAAMIEKHLTKDQILELYLNQVFYGAGAYGISAAADVYFDKELDELTVAEAALLARCVRRPSDENPFENPRKAIQNRNVVLKLMLDEKLITDAQYKESIEEPLKLAKERPQTVTGIKKAPYFVDYVESQIKKLGIDISAGGYRVETTLNYKAQTIADKGVRDGVAKYKSRRVNDGAFILLDKDGRVMAMVGGKDYNWSQFNKTVQGGRQPGSSFKPVVYAAAFETGALSPGGSVNNSTVIYRGTRKSVSGGGPQGYVSVSGALANSYNRAAVWAIRETGPENVVHIAQNNFGYWNKLNPYESLALGASDVTPYEQAQAFSAFQGDGSPEGQGRIGQRAVPFGIVRIIGPTGEVVYEKKPERIRAISPNSAMGMDTCLRQVVTSGTGRAASGVVNARGKTGTTNDNKDAWFCGYTDKFVAVMWIGNPRVVKNSDGSERMTYDTMASSAMGGKVSCPIWADIMKKIQAEFKETRRSMRGGFGGTRIREENDDNDRDLVPPIGEEEEVPPTTTDVPVGTDPTVDPTTGNPPVSTETTGSATGGGTGTTAPPATTGGGTTTTGGTATSGGGTSGGGVSQGGGTTSVDICADSGQRASVYCPERVTRRFPRGQEPGGRCPIHGR